MPSSIPLLEPSSLPSAVPVVTPPFAPVFDISSSVLVSVLEQPTRKAMTNIKLKPCFIALVIMINSDQVVDFFEQTNSQLKKWRPSRLSYIALLRWQTILRTGVQ